MTCPRSKKEETVPLRLNDICISIKRINKDSFDVYIILLKSEGFNV